jgi:hypothetical protein
MFAIRSCVRALLSAALLVELTAVGISQTTLASWQLPNVRALGCAGDVDGDGVVDVFAASSQLVTVMSGATKQVIRSFAPGITPPPGWQIHSAAGGGDIDNDGYDDILFGMPNDSFVGQLSGTVWAYSGRTSQPIWVLHGLPLQQFGHALAFVGDVDADGHDDFAVGAPGANANTGLVRLISGRTGAALWTRGSSTPARRFGSGLTIVGDLDLDGLPELAISDGSLCCMYYTDIKIVSTPANASLLNLSVRGVATVRSAGDFDSDGVPDLLAAIDPDTNNGPLLKWFSGASGALIAEGPTTLGCCRPDLAISDVADFNGDGVAGEFAVTLEHDWEFFSGSVRIFEGSQSIAMLHPLGYGTPTIYLPIVAAIPDLNGDGAAEFLVATYGGNSAALIQLQTMLSPPPTTYCTAKVNSLGCTPRIQTTGNTSITTAQALDIRADQVVNQRQGMFLWSYAPAATPFLGGTLCLTTPLRRTAPQSSGGSASGADCTGQLQLQITSMFLGLNGLPLGEELFGQFWYRDPAHVDGTSSGLSDAVRFVVCF